MVMRIALLSLGAFAVMGCSHTSAPVPATLTADTPEARALLIEHLSQAVGRANITLGPGDLSARSDVSVLPPPLGEHETRSPAQPAVFDLQISGDACYAVPRDGGAPIALPGVDCRPV